MHYKRLFVVVMMFAVSLLLVSCGNDKVASTKNETLSVDVSYGGFATEEDFDKYHNVEFDYYDTPEGYRLAKMHCVIKNKAKFPVAYISAERLKNKSVYCADGALDYEPTYPLTPDSTYECDLYVYVSEKLSDEEAISTLSETEFEFSGISAAA